MNLRVKFDVFSSNRSRDTEGSHNFKSRSRNPFPTCKWGSSVIWYLDSSTRFAYHRVF